VEAFRWDDTFATGIDDVDRQHRYLVDIINAFGSRLQRPPDPGPEELAPVYAELAEYASYHFIAEEELMVGRGLDPRHVIQHQREHADFLRQVGDMVGRTTQTPGQAAQRLVEFLVHWLSYHILGSDQSMARQMRAVASGRTPAEAVAEGDRVAGAATATLLRSVNALFDVLSVRNRELVELAQSLEAKVVERTQALSGANDELQHLVRRVEHMAMTDFLTGLPNRRHAMERMAAARAASVRHGQPLACMLIDADGFKQVNDAYGHEAGDGVLKALAGLIRESVRAEDDACRLGGDEFLVVCPQTPLDGAVRVAERVREAIAGLNVPAGAGAWRASVSVGVAALTPAMLDLESLLRAADEGVYLAKRRGRNCVAVARTDEAA
jgi:diguanylate cyclase (GGDEF)-like protein/hemerythrin-like metal-binding protein